MMEQQTNKSIATIAFANNPFRKSVVCQSRIEQKSVKKQRLFGVIIGAVLLLSVFIFNPGSTHAAVRSATTCSFHTVEQDEVLSAIGRHMAWLYLLSNRCGSVEIKVSASQSFDIGIALSDGYYYQLYSFECPLNYSCMSGPLSYGNTRVFASTTLYFQGTQYAYGETGYHTGYQ